MNIPGIKIHLFSCVLGLIFSGLTLAAEILDQEKETDNAKIQKVQALQAEIIAEKPESSEVQRVVNVKITSDAILLVDDPWTGMNRAIYGFNAKFDQAIFLPTVRAYQKVTPDLVESGISNFFSNLTEVRNLFNNILQFRVKDSAITLARFSFNTTVGVFGLWDPATKIGLYQKPEDFGQTLGYWGLGSGPYLVLPFFGPSSLRDTGGVGVDFLVDVNVDLLNLKEDENKDGLQAAVNLLKATDTRKNTAFRYYNTGSPFEYELVRFTFTELRKIQIEK